MDFRIFFNLSQDKYSKKNLNPKYDLLHTHDIRVIKVKNK